MAQKLKDVPEEKIVSPEPYVAVPALQAISYCMDSEELREMFANLLATAMNADTKDDAHPAFVEIIKQLSPLDAKILKHFNTLENRLLPLCQIRVQKYSPSKNVDLGIGPHPFKDMTEGFDVLSNFLIIDEISSESKLIATSFDNLNRLGIVFPKHGHTLSDINKYKPFISHPTVLKYLDEFEQKKSTDAGFTEGKEVVLIRSLFRITDFGISLFKAIL